MTGTNPEGQEPKWRLPPFTHIRCVGTYEEYTGSDTTYRAFLIFVHDGRAAVARLPLIVGNSSSRIWDQLEDVIRHVHDLLGELELEQRVEFHRNVDETVDLYFRLEQMSKNLRDG